MDDNVGFAFAYYVEDNDVKGVAIGSVSTLTGEDFNRVISLEAARSLGEQLLSVVDAIEERT